jgi:hypothetical protein
MESFISWTTVIELGFLSFFLALWVTRLSLNGLFRLLPATSRNASPVRFAADLRNDYKARHAA